MSSPSTIRPDADLVDRVVLIVEDDPTVAEVAERYLVGAGLRVQRAADGEEGLRLAQTGRPDLIVLDRMLPGLDGIEVCRRIRSESAIPILMLTALDGEDDRILGLEAGADDYLVKPFSPRELVLRVLAVLRRTVPEPAPSGPIERDGYRVDPAARIASLHGVELALTVREFDLLTFLLRHPDQAFDRETLLREVWGWTIGDLSTVTVHVRRLREKLEAQPGAPRALVTVWGVGYRFETRTPDGLA